MHLSPAAAMAPMSKETSSSAPLPRCLDPRPGIENSRASEIEI